MATFYQTEIKEILARTGHIGTDPRHVEAWMRLWHRTLDALSETEFRADIQLAAGCMVEQFPQDSERLAQSYGL